MNIIEKFPGIYLLENQICTINIRPGLKVYGEKLVEYDGIEYRLWDPRRSKLAAALLNGLETFPVTRSSSILYLGASAGTTASHFADIITEGLIYCLEFSPRMMRELREVCLKRKKMIPIMADATRPRSYLHLLTRVDLVYADVAQPRQTELFQENMRLYLKENGLGIIMIKSRSIDVTRPPKKIFREEEAKLKQGGYRIVDKIDLEPYEKDHRALVVEKAF